MPSDNEAQYQVRVWFDARDNGQVWGPFSSRGAAEETVVALAVRNDVKRVAIEKE